MVTKGDSMFGSFISAAIKVATLPLDVAESAADLMTGGDGSTQSKRQSGLPLLSELRDAACDKAEEIDR